MTGFDLLTPWIVFGLTLAALIWIQRWLQRHIFGVGWIVAQENHLATVIYYMVLLPGVFIHEFSHWLVAGVVNVKTKRLTTWPKIDKSGELEPAFIKVEDTKNPVFLTLIGIAPFVSGLALVLLISGSMLHLPDLIKAFATNDVNVIAAAFQTLLLRPDFVLWFYLLFAIGNTMMPGKADREGWLIIGGLIVGALIFLAVIGFSAAEIRWFSGPIPAVINSLTAVFLMIFAVDVVVAFLLFAIERLAERLTQRQAPYRKALATTAKSTEAARARAARAPTPLTSIYEYVLPLPVPGYKPPRPALAARTGSPAPAGGQAALPRPTPANQPALGSPAPRPTPALPSIGSQPAPAYGSAPRPAEPPRPANVPLTPARPATGPLTPMNPPRSGIPASTSPSPTPLARPGLPAPGIARPAAASTGSPTTAGGIPPLRSPLGAPRPAPVGSSPSRSDDYIDADVIEDDEPDFMKDIRGGRPFTGASSAKPAAGGSKVDDSDDVRYVNLDDAP